MSGLNPELDPVHRSLENIQAHLLIATKFADGRTRDWSLFFFFRIMAHAEVKATAHRAKRLMKNPQSTEALATLLRDFEQPSLVNAGLVDQELARRSRGRSPDAPSEAFLNWLRVLTSGDKGPALKAFGEMVQALGIQLESKNAAARIVTTVSAAGGLASDAGLSFPKRAIDVNTLRTKLAQYATVLANAELYTEALRQFGGSPAEAGLAALKGSLPMIALYEMLRQGAPAFTQAAPLVGASGAIVGQAAELARRGAPPLVASPYDPAPVNLAFTFSGLSALKLNGATLTSFPEPFKQGMAARARRLNDTGASAPQGWEGVLGLRQVHGYFTGGFLVGDHTTPVEEAHWRRVRADIAAFNDPSSERGRALRLELGLLFRLIGLEILHIELGQDPYNVVDGLAVPLNDRVEHFGFRDGLSQPFLDMGLGDTLPGGGTPARDGTWAPVAPGEIYLDLPDEDGGRQDLPISAPLRAGSTYLVFRKLEQDVPGFRTFVERGRPDRREALAAEFVGRWPNGTPLVLSPDAPRAVKGDAEAVLNDFRYAQDDPLGRSCPLGAHIRRANPRDTGGRGEVKRHRILRRSIAYGGPLLPDGSLGDGWPRGLLFVAANARIDLQFEVIQADWINNGEFLGQAGLGRCPLVGANDSGLDDSFVAAGGGAPVTRLPRFVVTRGGDYFFAPGIEALRLIAKGDDFAPASRDVPYGGFAMGDAVTPGLFDATRLAAYGTAIITGQATCFRVVTPPTPKGEQQTVAFVGRHEDALQVLRDGKNVDDKIEFSVLPYHLTALRITRGRDVIVSTDLYNDTATTRQRLHALLNAAWSTLAAAIHDPQRSLREIVRKSLDAALRRTASEGRIDLVSDLAVQAAYAVLSSLFGVAGPSWITELALALPFADPHVGELPPEWLAALKARTPQNPGLTSLQTWSAIILADLLGNVEGQAVLDEMARQAGMEMLTYVDAALQQARASEAGPHSLVGAFVANEPDPTLRKLYPADADWPRVYYEDAGLILLEIVGSTMATIPMTFASVMAYVLGAPIDLPRLFRWLTPSGSSAPSQEGVDRLIHECERLNSVLGLRMRHCEQNTTLPSGAKVAAGDWVGVLITAANRDYKAFPKPLEFSLAPCLPGPKRPMQNYLLFGEVGSERVCWGRNRVALAVLEECMLAAGRLEGLRPVAGAGGSPVALAGVTVGLPARFRQVASPEAAPPW